jgi:general stress protein YciG
MAEQRHTGNSGNFAEDRAKASRAGHIGGQHSSGNFAHNPQRAAEAGRKGGLRSRGGGGARTNPGGFAESSGTTGSASGENAQQSHARGDAPD